jgi:hypothetical protein
MVEQHCVVNHRLSAVVVVVVVSPHWRETNLRETRRKTKMKRFFFIFCTWIVIVFQYTMVLGSSNVDPNKRPPSFGTVNYVKWCSNFEQTSIYDLGLKLLCDDNYQMFCIGLMAVVFFTLCIEITVHSLEHHISNYVTLEIVHRMYKELMVSMEYFLFAGSISHFDNENVDNGLYFVWHQCVRKYSIV